MARTDPAERGPLFAAREAALRDEVAHTALPASERELADMLLENGSWLAVNDDPVDAVERSTPSPTSWSSRFSPPAAIGNRTSPIATPTSRSWWRSMASPAI